MFKLRCPTEDQSDEMYEIHLMSGVEEENQEMCGLKIYPGKTQF